MPRQPIDTISFHAEFVRLAPKEDGNFRKLCRRFGI
jgi:hypothetical protein